MAFKKRTEMMLTKKFLALRLLVIVIGILSLYWNSEFRTHAAVEDGVLHLIMETNKAENDRIAHDYSASDFLMNSHSLRKVENWTSAQGGSRAEDYRRGVRCRLTTGHRVDFFARADRSNFFLRLFPKWHLSKLTVLNY